MGVACDGMSFEALAGVEQALYEAYELNVKCEKEVKSSPKLRILFSVMDPFRMWLPSPFVCLKAFSKPTSRICDSSSHLNTFVADTTTTLVDDRNTVFEVEIYR